MTPNEYQQLAQRTVMSNVDQTNKIITALEELPRLSHVVIAALKLNSESGELSDSIVKHLCYGQKLDIENIEEECGDLLWYIALILEKVNSNMELCMEKNITKLQLRYPEKFTEEHAKIRLDKQSNYAVYCAKCNDMRTSTLKGAKYGGIFTCLTCGTSSSAKIIN